MSEILTAQKEKVETKKLSEQDKKKEIFLLEKTKQKVWKIQVQEIKNKLKELEENKELEQELGIFNEQEYLQTKLKLEEFLQKTENNENINTKEFQEISEKITKLNHQLNQVLLIDKVLKTWGLFTK